MTSQDRWRRRAATLFGIGELPPMGGTYATFIAAGAYILIHQAGRTTETIILVAVIALCSAAGYWLVPWAERHYGKTDPQPYVLDEVAGYFLSVLAVPAGLPLWVVLAASVFLFRVFDVLKPLPINALQKLPGAVGVVADDLMAGVYTNGLIQIIAAAVSARSA